MTSLQSSAERLPGSMPSDASSMDAVGLGFARIAVAAGAVVMSVYERGAVARIKTDSSPVCDADEQAEALIQRELAGFAPGVPVLAEEAASRGYWPNVDGRFILVDPVDGTKEFLNRNGEFTVNIALIERGVPRAGAVYAPALGKLWFAGDRAFTGPIAPGADLDAARMVPIHSRAMPAEGLSVMASRSHADPATEAFLARLPVHERRNAGSSLKFCALAEGTADLYPRFGPTMEWDTAAGDAVLRAAGGIVVTETGEEFMYGKTGSTFRNGAFVAWGDPRAMRQMMGAAPDGQSPRGPAACG